MTDVLRIGYRVSCFEREGEGEGAHDTLLARYRTRSQTPDEAFNRARRRLKPGSRFRVTHMTAIRVRDGALFYWAKE